MRLLILSFYFQPDLCAGSFRTTALVEALQARLREGDEMVVITTMPNRYHSFHAEAPVEEQWGNVRIHRIALPSHKSSFFGQAYAFSRFFFTSLRMVRSERFDLVAATSSRLFTAFLGACIARRMAVPLYLDIRDLFVDTMRSLLTRTVRFFALPFFTLAERFTFHTANHINIVSAGFRTDVARLAPQASISVHTNGIDELFLQHDFTTPLKTAGAPVVLLYAGNLGQGQGMERIIPGMAHKLGNGYEFRIIGDGGTRRELEQRVKGLSNVRLLDPVDRDTLLRHYREADILFLHLNDCVAFDKVLPSKIFEYAATGKPVLAGVRGEARAFLRREVAGSYCFDPGDAAAAAALLATMPRGMIERGDFISRFSRKRIMRDMVKEILLQAHGG